MARWKWGSTRVKRRGGESSEGGWQGRRRRREVGRGSPGGEWGIRQRREGVGFGYQGRGWLRSDFGANRGCPGATLGEGSGYQPLGWRERAGRPHQIEAGNSGKEKDTEACGKRKQTDFKGSTGNVEMGEAEEREDADTNDHQLGIKCSRCNKRGHAASRCIAELHYVICDGHDHLNHMCLILKQSRPVAHAVGYAVHGLGFYHIPHPPLPKTKRESSSTMITVVGGELSKEQIILQL